MSSLKLESEYKDLDKYNINGWIEYYKKGTKIWHNPYGPACIGTGVYSSYKAYFIDGECHRLNGPAKVWPDGYEEYWINDKQLTKKQFEIHPERLKFLGKEHLICLT